MKAALMICASMFATVAVSQPTFARDFSLPQTNTAKQNTAGGGATGALNKAKSVGGLSGLGVPSGTKGGGLGADIMKSSGLKPSIMPSTVSDTAKEQVKNTKGQQGGPAGVLPKDDLSARQMSNMRAGAAQAKASAAGATVGVQQQTGVSPGQTSDVQIGVQKAKEYAGGGAAGVEPKDPGVKLSDKQIKAIKNSRINPVVNQGAAEDDDGKGKGGKLTPADLRAAFKPVVSDAVKAGKAPDATIDRLKQLLNTPKPPPK
jgi:hypothetical protein